MTTRWLTLGMRDVRPSVIDVLVSALGLFFVTGAHYRFDGAETPTGTLVFGLLSAVIVLFRRRWPIPVLIAVFVVAVVALTTNQTTPALVVFPLFVLFTVANQTDRRTTVITGVITGLALYIGIIVHSGIAWDQGASLGILAWTGMFAAAGDTTRNRRNYIEAIEERARKAESERDTEAARQVAEERLRIARELHDVLAHHIAVIHVHAGLADATMISAPDTSKESLGHIRHAARDVLDELGALIPVLRGSDEVSSDPAPPAPGLDRLDDLLDSYRRAGSPVRLRVSGKPVALPAAGDLAAYRIIQEALTNAAKHGIPGTTDLVIRYTDDVLEVRVQNLVPSAGGSAVPGTGHGLIGMRERATSVGAALEAGRERDGFRVELRLAIPERVR